MHTPQFVLYILSAGLILLGFIALLTQKIYIDSSTNEPVSVSIPAIGKVKTNYPALIFVLGGIFLAWYSFDKSMIHKQKWIISGTLEVDPDQINEENKEKLTNIDWSGTRVVPLPTSLNYETVARNGYFEFSIDIPYGYSFEEKIDQLKFSNHPYLIGTIYTEDAVEQSEILIGETGISREYTFLVKPQFPPENEPQ